MRRMQIGFGFGWFLTVTLLMGQSSADEGMWVYNQLPTKILKERYGFEPPTGWADHLMRSSVRFNSGGSGSFVSSTGLVLTNHHVAADTLAKISTAEHNYYRDGFLAKTLTDEVPAPDLELNQLVDIVDVTDRVNQAVAAEPADKAQAARQAAIATIEKESTEQTKLRSDVITLYQGGAYHLYRYKKYTDVRLAFAPEFSIAFFGGDADNFEYPRHDLDMALFRVYENGQPAKIEHFLKWSAKGAADGELIFVSGHPARTSRLLTVDALQFQRDVRFPAMVNLLRRREITLQQFAADGEEFARRAKKDLFGVQNSRKRSVGQMQSLHDPRLFDAKKAAEVELRYGSAFSPLTPSGRGAGGEGQSGEPAALSPLTPNPSPRRGEGDRTSSDPWDRIAAANEHHAHLFKRHMLLETGAGFYSDLFSIARSLVRMAAEDEKPNEKRLAEYRDSGRESLKRKVFSPAPIYEDLERAKLTDSLAFLLEELKHEPDVLQKALAGKGPVARAAELVSGTKLKDVEERKRIASGGWKAIESSTDTMIVLARDIDERSRLVRKELETSVEEPERQAYGEIAKLRFAKFGTSVYPDATFTLRLAFGTVKGIDDGDSKIPAWTTMAEAFEHEAAHGGQEPWKLPRTWHERKSKLDLAMPLNFSGTADGVGGNSGSPVVNRAGEVVGLIFDSNIPALANEFRHSSDVGGRSISVHSAGMLEAMRKIYDAGKLADELGR